MRRVLSFMCGAVLLINLYGCGSSRTAAATTAAVASTKSTEASTESAEASTESAETKPSVTESTAAETEDASTSDDGSSYEENLNKLNVENGKLFVDGNLIAADNNEGIVLYCIEDGKKYIISDLIKSGILVETERTKNTEKRYILNDPESFNGRYITLNAAGSVLTKNTKKDRENHKILLAPYSLDTPHGVIKTATIQEVRISDEKLKLVASYDYYLPAKFKNGCAWASYKEESGQKRVVAIDDNFKIIYKPSETVREYFHTYDFGEDGCSFYTFNPNEDENSRESVIIKSGGTELYRLVNNSEDTTCYIVGHGGDSFLVYKKVRSFSQNSDYIYSIDGYGNLINPEQEIPEGVNAEGYYEYHGEGIFSYYNKHYGKKVTCFYNANTGEFIYNLDVEEFFITDFEDGEAYYRCVKNGDKYQTIVTPDIFDSHETFWEWHDSWTNDNAVSRFTPELHYNDPIKVTGCGYGSGGLYPVQLEGADGNSYFTMVDEEGNQQFEPIKYPGFKFIKYTNDYTVQEDLDARFKDGVFVYRNEKDSIWNAVYSDGTTRDFSIDFINPYEFQYDGTYLYLQYNASFPDRSCVVNVVTGKVFDKIYLYNDYGTKQTEVSSNKESKKYVQLPDFSIVGKWKNIGNDTYGQAQSGAIIIFNGNNCNFYSPNDTYAFYKNGNSYRLDCTGLMGDTASFTVQVVDKNNIDITFGGGVVELTRVE